MEYLDFSNEINQLIKEANLSFFEKRHVKKYLSQAVPKILIQPKTKMDFSNRSTSFFGGMPALPSVDQWPVDGDGNPGLFLCQIDCAEIHKVVPDQFPDKGLLFFFHWFGLTDCIGEPAKLPTVLYLDIPSDTAPITSLPCNYKGGGMDTDTWFKVSRCTRMPESKEKLDEAILPRFDMTFWLQDDFPCRWKFDEKYDVSAKVDGVLCDIELSLEALVKQAVRPEHNSELQFLNPQTIKYSKKSRSSGLWVDNTGYPWSGLHISTFAGQLAARFSGMIGCPMHQAKDLLALWEEFGLEEAYKVSYKNTSYRDKPSLKPMLFQYDRFSEMEVWLEQHHPDLLTNLFSLKYCEEIIIEANEWYKAFIDKPYDEPAEEDKDRFNYWLAGWFNAIALLIYQEDIEQGETLENKPVRQIPEKALSKIWSSINGVLSMTLEQSALDASAVIAAYSSESASRLPDDVFKWIDSKCWNSYPHYLLGQPRAVQNADENNPDSISLLTIENDHRLMFACGTGNVLQYWIKPEDLKNKIFDKVVMSAECT